MGFDHTKNHSTPHSTIPTPAPWGMRDLGLASSWAYLGCPLLLMWIITQGWHDWGHRHVIEITFIGSLIGWVSVFAHWYHRYPYLWARALGLHPVLSWQSTLGFTLLGIMGILTLGGLYGTLQRTITLPSPTHLLPPLPKSTLWIMGGLAAPLVEEWVFRGAFISTMLRYTPPWVAIVISSVLFTAMHLSYQQYPMVLGYVFLLGLWLGFIRIRSGSLWPSFWTHGLNNLLVLFTLLQIG